MILRVVHGHSLDHKIREMNQTHATSSEERRKQKQKNAEAPLQPRALSVFSVDQMPVQVIFQSRIILHDH